MSYPRNITDFEDLKLVSLSNSNFFCESQRTYPRQSLEAEIMAFYRLYPMASCKPSVSIHDEGYMSRDWALPQCPK